MYYIIQLSKLFCEVYMEVIHHHIQRRALQAQGEELALCLTAN